MSLDAFYPLTTNGHERVDSRLLSVTLRSFPLNPSEWSSSEGVGALKKKLEGLGVRAQGLRKIQMTRGEVLRVHFPVNTFFLLVDPAAKGTKGYKVDFEAYEGDTAKSAFKERIHVSSFNLVWVNPLGVSFFINDHIDSTDIYVTEGELELTPAMQNHFFPPLDKQQTMQMVWERARRNLEASDSLLELWDLHGLHNRDLPSDMHVFVVKYDEEGMDHFRYLNQMTLSSVFPIDCQVISMKDIETTIEAFRGREAFCVFLTEGSYITNAQKFFHEAYREAQRLRREQQPLACHIMDFRGEGRVDRAPYMHEQFFIVNMEEFSKLPPFKNFFSHGHFAEFTSYKASEEQIHDHYTPHWLAPHGDENLQLKYEWGSEVLHRVLQAGYTVLNVSTTLRDQKRFAYPNEPDNFDQEQKVIAHRNLRNLASANRVFAFNVFDYGSDEIIESPSQEVFSLASGFIPLLLFNKHIQSLERFYFYDKNPSALQYWYDLIYTPRSYKELKQQVFSMARYVYPISDDGLIDRKLRNIIDGHFDGDESRFLKTLYSMKERSEFHKVDILDSPSSLARLGNAGAKKMLWFSNIFSTHFLFQLYSQEEVQSRYKMFVESFAQPGEEIFLNVKRFGFFIRNQEGRKRVIALNDNLTLDVGDFSERYVLGRDMPVRENEISSRIFI